jgi:hypothetical protein
MTAARFVDTRVFPVPPFPLAIDIVFIDYFPYLERLFLGFFKFLQSVSDSLKLFFQKGSL